MPSQLTARKGLRVGCEPWTLNAFSLLHQGGNCYQTLLIQCCVPVYCTAANVAGVVGSLPDGSGQLQAGGHNQGLHPTRPEPMVSFDLRPFSSNTAENMMSDVLL